MKPCSYTEVFEKILIETNYQPDSITLRTYGVKPDSRRCAAVLRAFSPIETDLCSIISSMAPIERNDAIISMDYQTAVYIKDLDYQSIEEMQEFVEAMIGTMETEGIKILPNELKQYSDRLQGRIEGSTVLCGSSDLMQLMNVKVPYRLVDRTTVLLAIDGVLYGIFKINYVGLPEIRTALQELIASNRHPIFAIRDFNITPDLLHEVFDVATDGYDFPPYGDRFRISEAKPSETSKVSAVICREGLGPLTHLADTGRSMYVAIRMNLIITAAVAVIGMILVFFKLIGTGEVSAWLPFVLMLLDAIIVSLISLFMRF